MLFHFSFFISNHSKEEGNYDQSIIQRFNQDYMRVEARFS